MNLFGSGYFQLHSGRFSKYKIDCDALSDDDIAAIARMIVDRLPPFGSVEGIPQGGLRLAAELARWTTPYQERKGVFGARSLLIVDDVYTTGMSMEAYRDGRDTLGAVIFARDETPDWIMPLFTLAPE